MSLAIMAIVYPIIFIGELPDKTMAASLALATRGRPAAVWAGAAAAFAVHVAIAVTAGSVLVTVLPSRVVQIVTAVLFLAGAIWVLRLREAAPAGADAGPATAGQLSTRGAVATAFAVVFVAEWGDLTQVLTAGLAARYHAPLAVGLGAGLALWSIAGLAVTAGRLLALLPAAVVRRVTALVLVALAAAAAAQAVTGRDVLP